MVSELLDICSGYCSKWIMRYAIFLKLNILWDAKGMSCYIILFWEPRGFLQGADFRDLICGSTKERKRQGRGLRMH